MVLGLFVDLTIVNNQAHSSGARFSNKETAATMAGIARVFIFFDKASIYTFLDLGSISSIWSCEARYGRRLTTNPSNSGLSLRSIWASFLQDRGGGNAPNTSWYFLMSLLRRGSRFKLSGFSKKILLRVEVALPFFALFHPPHSFRGQLIIPVLANLLGIVEGVHQGCLRLRESHSFIIVLGPD